VQVDQGQMEQVVLNVFINAWQAMPGGGDLTIRTENVRLTKDYAKPYVVTPGKFVKISIADTGIGMDEDVRQRIFEPFFSTKGMGRGTGLGLASTYGIIQNHGGFINVESEKDAGTTFHIYLPAFENKVPTIEKTVGEVAEGTGNVLLVDDEAYILDIGRKLMGRFGYKVITAGSGQEALEIYEQDPAAIDIVILDMIMPKLDGGKTYDRLKKIDPNVKVLLSSGYSIAGKASEILKRGCNGFIQKPFDIRELSSKIKALI
jgi:CheY-like chemotaxis protein